MPAMLADMVATSEAARRVGVSAERVRQWLRDGTLPSIETPLGHLIKLEDVEALAARRAQQRTAVGARLHLVDGR